MYKTYMFNVWVWLLASGCCNIVSTAETLVASYSIMLYDE